MSWRSCRRCSLQTEPWRGRKAAVCFKHAPFRSHTRTIPLTRHVGFAHDLMDTDMVLDSAPVPASQASTTNSQASSFQNSIPSQETGGSQFLPHAPSQSLPDQRNAASLTPPSSQSIPVPPSPHVLSNVQKPPVNGNLNSTSPIEPNASPSSALPQSNGLYQTASTHGQKRTASGQVKASSSSLPVSPIDGLPKGHSRKTPSISNIGEVRITSWLRVYANL